MFHSMPPEITVGQLLAGLLVQQWITVPKACKWKLQEWSLAQSSSMLYELISEFSIAGSVKQHKILAVAYPWRCDETVGHYGA